MIATLRNAWKIEELRKKILYTMLILVVVRLGSQLPVPFLAPESLKTMVEGGGSLLSYLNVLSGGAFSSATLFALSISPYITSSIVIQLLTVAIPALEQMAKSGEDGRKKLQQITRYTTVVLALLQAFAYWTVLRGLPGVLKYTSGAGHIISAITIISMVTAGAMILVWLGERIDEKGIGNGISLILFVGIVSQTPGALMQMYSLLTSGNKAMYFWVPAIAMIFILLVTFIVLMSNAERRIPIQYAKKVVGRKMYGGQSSFIPIKVNMSGVLPVIFASTFLGIPGTIAGFVRPAEGTFWHTFLYAFNYNTWLYAVLYFFLIIGFSYFYIAIQYNPIEMANNIRKNNGAIPGIRPGKPTSDFIARIINKITMVGALMLAVIAILPIGVGALSGTNIALGGTSIIILVGVALDTVRTLESQMMMRHYKGFLE